MKINPWFIGIFIFTIWGCSGDNGSQSETATANQRRDVVEQLERLGFYKDLTPDLITKAKDQVVQTGHLFAGVPERVVCEPDIEDIEEGKARNYLQLALPTLARRGVTVTNIEEIFELQEQIQHILVVDGTHYVLSGPQSDDITINNFVSLLQGFLKVRYKG